MLLDIFTVVTNLSFIVTASVAARLGVWAKFMICVMILVNSSMYHVCNSFTGYCAFEAIYHRRLDFFFAQLTIPATTLHLIHFSDYWSFLEWILLITAGFAIFVVQISLGESLYIQMSIAAISLGTLTIYWICYAIWYASKHPSEGLTLPKYVWSNLGWGIAMTSIACSLFGAQLQYRRLYWAIHSCWHVNAAFGLVFMLLSKERTPGAEYKSLASKYYLAGKHPPPEAHKRVLQLRNHETPMGRVREKK